MAARSRTQEACVNSVVAAKNAARIQKLRKEYLVSEGDTEGAVGQADAQAAIYATRPGTRKVWARIDVAARARCSSARSSARPSTGTVAEINGEVGEFAHALARVGIGRRLPAVDLVDTAAASTSPAPIDEVDAPARARRACPRPVRLDAVPRPQRSPALRAPASRPTCSTPRSRRARSRSRLELDDAAVDAVAPARHLGRRRGHPRAPERRVLRVPTAVAARGRQGAASSSGGRLAERTLQLGLAELGLHRGRGRPRRAARGWWCRSTAPRSRRRRRREGAAQ
ncbi:MAG: hypothetical protein MZV49_08815 [Rhodopseudomonas palustris]|nr:hypothetical protein [Rhodopseudomonas palustris]